ncbi:hypothetical protein [Pseudonocardia oceani]|uniref:PknH-like protein n=1 Tax=Pseudonocardia oceani TaxID=2792013 RepID=A0ABS6UJ72_9PSEU|nr:hypothetical protein [Pseudonocardia oceani]MBW0132306.1 hypothetical protein [Pseudonocardia oceani]
MSTSSGPPPGWYRAADGRWYPPPSQQYGPPPPDPRQYGPPPGDPRYAAAPPPAPKRRGPGRALLVVGAVVVVLVVLGAFALHRLVTGIGESVGGLAGRTACDAVATDAVDSALGGTYEVVQLGGLTELASPVLDSRVLADGTSCWAVEAGEGGRLARIARYSGPDAAQRFAAERTAAMGTTQDQGGGISTSTSAYFNKDVQAGDEAFCTTGDFTASAGVLVRTGDLLVYVSTDAAGEGAGAVPDIEFDQAGGPSDAVRFGTDDANCDRAMALAAQVR